MPRSDATRNRDSSSREPLVLRLVFLVSTDLGDLTMTKLRTMLSAPVLLAVLGAMSHPALAQREERPARSERAAERAERAERARETGRPAARAAGMPLSPADGETVLQNPPDFTWPFGGADARYEVTVTGPDGRTQRAGADRNALSWPQSLQPGARYTWQVRGSGARAGAPMGGSFTVAPDAQPFLVPRPDDLFAKTAGRPHPRFKAPTSSVGQDPQVQRLIEAVIDQRETGSVADVPTPDESLKDTDTASFKAQKRVAKQVGQREAKRLIDLGLAMQKSTAKRLRDEGLRRLQEAADADPEGATGIRGAHHFVARDLVLGMALLYDALYPDMSDAQRRQVRESILARVESIREEFLGTRMQRQPYNSHGWVVWGAAAAAVSLVTEDEPRSKALFLDLVPSFITSIAPWGGDDGGYANGMGYGLWDVASLITPFDVLGDALGVDPYKKPWLKNMPRFFTYFMPPGAPQAPFADAAELLPVYDRSTAWTIRALAQRTGDPLTRWHAQSLKDVGEGPSTLMLAADAKLPEGAPPPQVPNALVLNGIGWAALHSSLLDPKRVSVYFKSSPYGSYNHGHADQNAFVLQAGGESLLQGTGYYDYYDSPHFRRWYQATVAHNAITFDGGKGQPIQDMTARGRIVRSTLAADADVVVGDATAAYGGQLTKALRTMVYLRPGLVIVHDVLASAQPRQWEWNLHAAQKFEGDARGARLTVGSQKVCVDVLQAPGVRFQQTSGFGDVPPESIGKKQRYAEQWHAAFVSGSRTAEAQYVVALRVGCDGAVPTIRAQGSGWTVSADVQGRTRRIQLGDGTASLE